VHISFFKCIRLINSTAGRAVRRYGSAPAFNLLVSTLPSRYKSKE